MNLKTRDPGTSKYLSAVELISAGESSVKGQIYLSYRFLTSSLEQIATLLHREGVTKIWGTVFDLTVGLHGFHIHEKGYE